MDLTSHLLAQCRTKTQALHLLEEWEDLVKGNLFGGAAQRDLPGGINNLTKENYEKVFDDALKSISAIEPLYLFVPNVLSDDDLNKIVAKLRQDYGSKFLVEIKVQRDLIGGCCLSYKGVFKDYSLKAKLSKLPITNF